MWDLYIEFFVNRNILLTELGEDVDVDVDAVEIVAFGGFDAYLCVTSCGPT